MGCVLHCVECPPVGGDTMWTNMVMAYQSLPDDIKEKIADLRAYHSIEASFGAAMPLEKRLDLKAKFPDAEHPVVRTHLKLVRKFYTSMRSQLTSVTITPKTESDLDKMPIRVQLNYCVT